MPRTSAAKAAAPQLPEHLEAAKAIRARLYQAGFSCEAVGTNGDRLGIALRNPDEHADSPEELVSLLRVSLTPEEFDTFRGERERIVELFGWERMNPAKR